MVKIRGIQAFRPKDPEEFSIPPYDVIDEKMEKELKTNPRSSIHVILPEGEGDEIYANAKKEMQKLIDNEIIIQENKRSIYVYRQEALDGSFSQEGLIMGVSIADYKEGHIKKHEHTREKPLKDRTAHIQATKMNTGLVWTTYKANKSIRELIEEIKRQSPDTEFIKFGYKQIIWKTDAEDIISRLKEAFKSKELYIADGHHRAASAAEFQKYMLKNSSESDKANNDANWNYFMIYAASDEQVRILPYNRVVKQLSMPKNKFLGQIMENFNIEILAGKFIPEEKGNIGMFFDGKWYKLAPKKISETKREKRLDVSVLQDQLITPILGIEHIRKNDNIFFIGGISDPSDMESYVTDKGNTLFFSLYPVKMREIEEIADEGKFMPPKSTWFDPKLLSGLLFNPLF
ncbi:MAG: DUF1015 family protein [Candidatus Lokiarchaeota archaeon]|nr:DUF1015 family protein [Candidatus Lokiarchaeota archaeon]